MDEVLIIKISEPRKNLFKASMYLTDWALLFLSLIQMIGDINGVKTYGWKLSPENFNDINSFHNITKIDEIWKHFTMSNM